MRSILDHGTKILFDSDTEPLLTPGFWILPLYRKLLNSASRNRPSVARVERKEKVSWGSATPQRSGRVRPVVWVMHTLCVVSACLAPACYRKASYAMCFHKSVQLHGRAFLEKGLLSPLCCLAVKWQMTGLISCCRKGTFGPPLLSKGLPQKRSPKQPFVKNGTDCTLSIFGWRSSLAGMCCPTGCIRMPPLKCLASDYMNCSSTGLPRAAKGIPMKRKHTVDRTTMKYRRGGCGIANAKLCHWFWTLKAFFMLSGARKMMLVMRLTHIWPIAQSGGKQERALTSSSDDDSCLMWGIRLSKEMLQWKWRTSKLIHGWQGGRTTWWKRWNEGLEGARLVSPFASFHLLCCVWFVLVCFGCVFCLVFVFGCLTCWWKLLRLQVSLSFAIAFREVDRPGSVLARQCRKKKGLSSVLKDVL